MTKQRTRPSSGDIIRYTFIGKTKNGLIFDQSDKGIPSDKLLGKDDLHIRLFNAFLSMKRNEVRNVIVPFAEAYGPRRKELIIKCPLEKLPKEGPTEVGRIIELTAPNGTMALAQIIALNETEAVLDLNHILAGEDLHYILELIDFWPSGI